jgi:hypothetical protein
MVRLGKLLLLRGRFDLLHGLLTHVAFLFKLMLDTLHQRLLLKVQFHVLTHRARGQTPQSILIIRFAQVAALHPLLVRIGFAFPSKGATTTP